MVSSIHHWEHGHMIPLGIYHTDTESPVSVQLRKCNSERIQDGNVRGKTGNSSQKSHIV